MRPSAACATLARPSASPAAAARAATAASAAPRTRSVSDRMSGAASSATSASAALSTAGSMTRASMAAATRARSGPTLADADATPARETRRKNRRPRGRPRGGVARRGRVPRRVSMPRTAVRSRASLPASKTPRKTAERRALAGGAAPDVASSNAALICASTCEWCESKGSNSSRLRPANTALVEVDDTYVLEQERFCRGGPDESQAANDQHHAPRRGIRALHQAPRSLQKAQRVPHGVVAASQRQQIPDGRRIRPASGARDTRRGTGLEDERLGEAPLLRGFPLRRLPRHLGGHRQQKRRGFAARVVVCEDVKARARRQHQSLAGRSAEAVAEDRAWRRASAARRCVGRLLPRLRTPRAVRAKARGAPRVGSEAPSPIVASFHRQTPTHAVVSAQSKRVSRLSSADSGSRASDTTLSPRADTALRPRAGTDTALQ
mmetsp:Transcript_33534/g.117547  ORF Transcript_33534/g.117547 Transcript_33534/m.117547 type:complete len:436 (-) Transcript_33534:164-1471(-)